MALESTLINSAGIVIAELFMPSQLLWSEQLVFMRENLLIPCAQIAHDLVMDALDMPMQVGPSPTGHVAVVGRAIVPQ